MHRLGPLGLLPALLLAAADLPARAGRGHDSRWLTANRWSVPFYNDGRLGIDLSGENERAGGTWPQPYHNQYIYGAGIWVGGIVRSESDSARRDTLVSFAYNPNSHGTEMAPVQMAHRSAGTTSPNDRMFVYPQDWPPRPRDWFVPMPELESLVPFENVSLADLWCGYSDGLEENHVPPGRPLGIDVYQSVYAWNVRLSQDLFFLVWYVRNPGRDTVRRCYIGLVADPDIGAPDDDMVGLLLEDSIPGAPRVRNTGYCSDWDNSERSGSQWESGTPAAFGCVLLEGPAGLSAFKKFSRTTDPMTDRNQYLTMSGFDYRTGVFAPFDSAHDVEVGDKRFLLSSGPFDLGPGDVRRLAVACFVATYGGPGERWEERPRDSLVHIARAAAACRFIYDAGWTLAGPPRMPGATLVPGDNEIRIVWDDIAEREPDRYWQKVARDPSNPNYDPKYRGDDFQGYLLFRSTDAENWRLLAQWDRADSIQFAYPSNGDSLQPESLWINATDAGIRRSYIDREVRNGFAYNYAVAAYDWNYQTTLWDSLHQYPVAWETLVFCSGLRTDLSATPRWDAADFARPKARIRVVRGDSLNPALACSALVAVPFMVTGDTAEVTFLEPSWSGSAARMTVRCRVRSLRSGSVLVDTFAFAHQVGAGSRTRVVLPSFNGLELDVTLSAQPPARGFDGAGVARGSYPSDSLRPGSAPPQAWWAWRGSDYRVVWDVGGGRLTARVFDLTNNVDVRFAPFTSSGNGPQNADGWCFVDKLFRNPTSTLEGTAAHLYIGGGYVAFRQSGDSLRGLLAQVQDGDTWLLQGHRVEGAGLFHNVWQVISDTAAPAGSRPRLDVKVVPNPYVAFDEWERSVWARRIRFTHLPSRCVIRIYTMSGDLLKTIVHSDTRNQPQDQGGTATWDLTSDHHLAITSGVYVFHVESDAGEFTGKFAVVK